MSINIISLSILLNILVIKIRAGGEKEDKFEQCRVFSPKYRKYISAYHKLWFDRERQIYPDYYRSFLDLILGREFKIEYSESDPRGVWIFEPVMGQKSAYYLRNQKYSHDYLKGSSSYVEWSKFKENFYVSAAKKHHDLNEYYMWRFNQTSSTSNRYYIWNVKNGSPLYMRTFKFDVVSLFDGYIGDDSEWKSFEWVIKCKDDLLPRYIGF